MPFDPIFCHLNVVQEKRQELLRLNERYEKKNEKYPKTLDRLTWLNAFLSGLSVASGISSVVTMSMFIGIPVSIRLGAICLAGASVSGVAMLLTKKYRKKLAKVTNLTNIVTSLLSVFETSVCKALKDGKFDKREFNTLQKLYYESFNNLSNADWKMEAENRNQFKKVCRKK